MREEGRKEGRGKKEKRKKKRKDRSERELQVRNMGKVEKSIMNVLIALVYRNEIRFFKRTQFYSLMCFDPLINICNH